MTSTTMGPKRKYGLAWLFSKNPKNQSGPHQKAKVIPEIKTLRKIKNPLKTLKPGQLAQKSHLATRFIKRIRGKRSEREVVSKMALVFLEKSTDFFRCF